MEIITLVRANIKRRKGAFIAVILLTAIIVASSLSIFNFIDSMQGSIEQAYADAGDPTEAEFIRTVTPELEEKLRSLDIVKKVDIVDAYTNWTVDDTSNRVGSTNDFNSYFFMKTSDHIKLIKPDLSGLESSLPALEKGEIYLPLGLKSKLKCDIGDTLETYFYTGKFEFKIKGFVQEPLNGSEMIGWKQVFISDEDFEEIKKFSDEISSTEYRDDPKMQHNIEFKVVYLYKSDDYKGSDEKFHRDVNLATKLGDMSTGNLTKAKSVNYSTLLPSVLSKIVLVFIAMLFVVTLVIMGHSISSEIEIDRKKLGILKSQGFTKQKIRLIMQVQYILAQLIGIALGLVISMLLTGVISDVFMVSVGVPITLSVSVFKAILLIVSLIAISVFVMTVKTHKIANISPVKAITGQKDEVYFDSRLKMNLSKRFLSLTLGIRQFTCAKRRYIGMLIISALLMYFMLSINLIGAMITSENALDMMGMEVTQLDMNLTNAGDDVMTLDEAEKIADEIIEKYTTIEKRFAVSNLYCSIDGYSILCRSYKYPQYIGGIIKGRQPRHANEILITPMVSDEFGWQVGDKVTVSDKEGSLECMVVGLYQSTNDAGMVFAIPFEAFETLNPKMSLTYEGYMLEDASKAQQIADEIDAALGKAGSCRYWDINDVGDVMYQNEVNLLKAIVYIFSAIFMLVAVVLLCTKAFVLERRDIGIYKAVGFTSGRLRMAFALRFSFVAALGSVAGLVLSLLLSEKMLSLMLRTIGLAYLELDFGLLDTLVPMAVLITGFFVFSLLASRKIKKVETRELVAE